jgi:hypothetical protein
VRNSWPTTQHLIHGLDRIPQAVALSLNLELAALFGLGLLAVRNLHVIHPDALPLGQARNRLFPHALATGALAPEAGPFVLGRRRQRRQQARQHRMMYSLGRKVRPDLLGRRVGVRHLPAHIDLDQRQRVERRE